MPHLIRDHISLFYISEGQGPPVLLLHGWACDSQDFIFQIPFFKALGYQVIAFDSRGNGRSSVPPESSPEQLRAEVTCDDAAALLQHLGVTEPAIVVGHSLGCLVASLLAVRSPKLVKALVLISPMYFNPAARYSSFCAMMEGGNVYQVLEPIFSSTVGPEWLKIWHRMRLLGTPEWVVYQTGYQNSLEPAYCTWEMGRTFWPASRVAPRLVVFPDDVNLNKEKELGVGDSDRLELLDAGHWLFVQDSDGFNAIIKDWLSTI
ncbi:hypothetical protein ACHAPT_010294 [Fusarium lateritium]